MKTIQLAKNSASFELLDQWHSRFERSLTFEHRTKHLETSFGFVDVMVTGDPNDRSLDELPPVLVVHGAMAGAPFALGELDDLPDRRRIYAVNIPGQSTRAAQVRLDFRTDDYSKWLEEVMDGLELPRALVCGVSWGGSVALQLAKHRPQRIQGLVLVVPASIVSGSVLQGIWKMAIPIMRYKMFPSEKNRNRALRNVFTSDDELWTPYLGDAIRHWKVDFTVPPLMSPLDLESLEAPVYVIAADQDLSFPGQKLLKRSRELFKNYIDGHLLRECRHSPSFRDGDRKKFAQLFESALQLVSAPHPQLLDVDSKR